MSKFEATSYAERIVAGEESWRIEVRLSRSTAGTYSYSVTGRAEDGCEFNIYDPGSSSPTAAYVCQQSPAAIIADIEDYARRITETERREGRAIEDSYAVLRLAMKLWRDSQEVRANEKG